MYYYLDKMDKKVTKNIITFNNMDYLIEHLKNQKSYKEAIKYGNNNYKITQYKINKVRLQEIPEMINLMELNYINLEKEPQQSAKKRKYTWLANELKLFVWMAVCHSFLSNKPLQEYDEQDWTYFTQIFTRKTICDLEFQSKSLFKNYHGNKEKWDDEEEELLKLIIEDQENKKKWNQISRLLYFRSNKKYYRSSQKCREYWFNHLNPTLNKNFWTIDQDLKLVKELQIYGFKWSKITQVIESTWGYRRTQHMIKNRTKLLYKKYEYYQNKEHEFIKKLVGIEKKLNEEKLKSLYSVISVKEEEFLQQMQPNSTVKIEHEIEQKKPTFEKKQNLKPKKSLSSSQEPNSQPNFEQDSSQESDFKSLNQKKPTSIKQQEPQNKLNIIILFQVKKERYEQKNKEYAFFEEYKIIEEVSKNPNIGLNQQMPL